MWVSAPMMVDSPGGNLRKPATNISRSTTPTSRLRTSDFFGITRGGAAALFFMRNILIPSLASDIHAIAIQSALEQRGHRVVRWIGDDFPSSQVATLALSNLDALHGSIRTQDAEFDVGDIDLVWLRRPRWPVAPKYLDQYDQKLTDEELHHWYRSIWESCWSDANWVNSMHGRRRANNKILQLKMARKSGLSVPRTLISNDPRQIRDFISSINAVVKPFQTQNWIEGSTNVSTLTARIHKEQLPDNQFIQACPAIYQECIDKVFEVRAFFCGKAALAISIDSQKQLESTTDWRAAKPQLLGIKPITVPAAVEHACFTLMDELGIVTGSFDFAVTPSGEWVFFEVNEQGQFMWMEQCAPEVTVTDMFVNFLEARSHRDFKYHAASPEIRLRELLNSPRTKEIVSIDASRERNEHATATL